jgi:predicted esterase
MEKKLVVSTQASYETFGELSEKTEKIYLICHGYGQLAKYFIRRFDVLDSEKNYVIAPQGLSKFYLNNGYDKVGASWLTKENREIDLQNALTYLQAIYFEEVAKHIEKYAKTELIVFGFSQGVSMAVRWAVANKIPFTKLILWAGRFPNEIQAENLHFVAKNAEIMLVIGKQDEFYQESYLAEETEKITKLLKAPQVIVFEGTHEVQREVLQKILN